jgi:hypothetical protein
MKWMRLMGHGCCMREIRNFYTILAIKSGGRRHFRGLVTDERIILR